MPNEHHPDICAMLERHAHKADSSLLAELKIAICTLHQVEPAVAPILEKVLTMLVRIDDRLENTPNIGERHKVVQRGTRHAPVA